MLIRFSVENFKSFNDRQELVMIPAKKLKTNKEHVIAFNKVSLLRNATIYGANASGKTNIIDAIRFAKHVITKKIPMEASKMYCRVFSENQEKKSKFEFEIYKNGKFYAYGFSLLMSEQIIKSEWLYELLPSKNIQTMLFERETDNNRLELGENLILDEIDTMRFKTYKLDFEDNNTGLFIREMNRNKKMNKESKLTFFRDVFEWFDEDLVTIFPDQPITDFEFSEESDGTRRLFDLLDILISNEKNKIYVIDELERSLHPKLTYKFLELFFEHLKDNNTQLIFTTHESTIMDQELLRRDEIWFVERNKDNGSHIYSLDRFKERYDKKLSKAYLEGRYGAVPVLKNFSDMVGDDE